jgi:hypothetical protein
MMAGSARSERHPASSFLGRSHLVERLAQRLSDPRRINPIWVFAGGLSVVLPIWLIFFNH